MIQSWVDTARRRSYAQGECLHVSHTTHRAIVRSAENHNAARSVGEGSQRLDRIGLLLVLELKLDMLAFVSRHPCQDPLCIGRCCYCATIETGQNSFVVHSRHYIMALVEPGIVL